MTDAAPATPPPTDTPTVVTVPPPSRMEQIKAMIGDLARPFAIYSISAATAWSIIAGQTADKIGAAGLIVAALFGAKAYENQQQTKSAAQVEVAKANASPPTA